MPNPRNLPGPLGAFAAAHAANDFAGMWDIALSVMTADEIVLPHPERPDILCRCRSSSRQGMTNFLFLADDDGGNRWVLVQAACFFKLAVTESAEHLVVPPHDSLVDRAIEQLRSGEYDHFWDARHRHGGLVVHSDRPFHFFYDQILHLPELAAALPAERRMLHVDDGAFLWPDLVWGLPTRPVEADHYYITPALWSGQRLQSVDRAMFYDRAGRMERAMAAAIPREPPEPRADLVLWIGITGQKRSWLEQVEGYAAIIRQLATRFPDMLVYVDGYTAPQGATVENRSDALVVEQLMAEIGACARVESLVGRDYPAKIALCHAVDVFIANGGTGCFVPLRVCRKPGLLHSNKNLWTFAGDSYPDTVVFTEPDIVREVPASKKIPSQVISYSIAWQDIHNRLLPILAAVKGVRLDPVPVPPPGPLSSPEFDRALFRQLTRNLKPKPKTAEILRDVAVLFEKKGDFATALAVMEQAHLQNPNGSVINRKLGEYRRKILGVAADGAQSQTDQGTG